MMQQAEMMTAMAHDRREQVLRDQRNEEVHSELALEGRLSKDRRLEQEMEMQEVNLEMQVARQEAEDRRVEEQLKLTAEQHKMQAETQEKTAELLEKSLGNRQKIKATIPKIKGENAINFFFELAGFGDAIKELQVGPSQMATKWRGFKGALQDQSLVKCILEELLAMDERKALLATDANDDYRKALELAIREMKEQIGLTIKIEKRLARKMWKDPSLHAGARGGVQEAEDFLNRIEGHDLSRCGRSFTW